MQRRPPNGMGNEHIAYRLNQAQANTWTLDDRQRMDPQLLEAWEARRASLAIAEVSGAYTSYIAPVAGEGYEEEQLRAVRIYFEAGRRTPVPDWLALFVSTCFMARAQTKSGYVLTLGRFELLDGQGVITATLDDMSRLIS